MKDNSVQRKSGVILSYLSILLSTLIQLMYIPFLTRMLGRSEYGLYSLIASIISYFNVLDLGFGNAIVVFTSKYRAQNMILEEKKLHGMFKMVFYVMAMIALIIGIILYFNINHIFGKTMNSVELYKFKMMFLIMIVNVFCSLAFSIYSSIITAYEKFVFQKVISILSNILKPLIMIPLLFLGYDSIALIIVLTLVNILSILSNYFYCKNKLKISTKFLGFDKIIFKMIFGYSIWIFLQILVDKINWNVDQLLLGAISGTIAVSIYSIASTLNQLFISLSTAISGVFLPKISKIVVHDVHPDILLKEMLKVGRLQYYVVYFVCTCLILFGKAFIVLWAGDDFLSSYYVALILIVPVCFPLVQNIGLSILQAMNKYKFKAIVDLIMSVFNIIISIILTKLYGVVGAAIGTALSLIICNIFIVNFYYYKKLGIDIFKFWKNILIMTFQFILPTIFIIIFSQFFDLYRFQNLFICGILYLIIYVICSIWFVMNDYEKELFYSFFERKKV